AFDQSEGKSYLGSANITTDSQGQASFDSSFPVTAQLVSATATDPAGNTSCFFTYHQSDSRCFEPGDLFIGFADAGNPHVHGPIQWRNSAREPVAIIFDSGSFDSARREQRSFSDLAF